MLDFFHLLKRLTSKKNVTHTSPFPQPCDDRGYYEPIYKDGAPCCPNCGSVKFVMGPEGGGCINVQCTECLEYYNFMGMFGFQKIGDRSEIFGTKKEEEYLKSPVDFFNDKS